MTLQKTLQANDAKVKELFSKLEDTSDQAVKTRENLFGELSEELRLHADLEKRDLMPALRGKDENKDLIAEANKHNRELLAKIDEIDALAKTDSSFRPRLAELRKLYQQQISVERKELVPAAQKALTDDKAKAVEDKMDARRAQLEEERRAEAEERRLAARREAESEKAAESAKKAAADVAEAAKLNARDLGKSAAEAVQQGARSARDSGEKAIEAVQQRARSVRESGEKAVESGVDAVRRVRDDASDRARKLRNDTKETVDTYRQTARERGADLKAVVDAVRNFVDVSSGIRSVMMTSIKQTGRDGLESSKQLLRNPRKFGEVQRGYAAATTRNIMESTEAIMQIVRSASAAGRTPVEERLRVVS